MIEAPVWKTFAILIHLLDIKGVKKVFSAIKLCFYYFSYYVSNGINVTEFFKVDTLDKK